jgi:hypothetical protein
VAFQIVGAGLSRANSFIYERETHMIETLAEKTCTPCRDEYADDSIILLLSRDSEPPARR